MSSSSSAPPAYSQRNPQNLSLPRYSTLFGTAEGPVSPITPTTAGARSTHQFTLEKSARQKTWATLELISSASSPNRTPRFHGGATIEGSIFLSLDVPEAIVGVVIEIRGSVITGASASGNMPFFKQAVTVWSRDAGDPNRPGILNRKLSGGYNWPFSFVCPTHGALPGSTQTFMLPQSFQERGARVSVKYDLVLIISRGWLQPDSKLQTPFIFVPDVFPEPSSFLQQVAYRDNMRPSGPVLDPDGWLSLDPVHVTGMIFNSRIASFICTLSLTRPWCYTRGTIIPLTLTIQSVDSQAMDLLATPNAILVILRRQLKYPIDVTGSSRRQNLNEETVDLANAVWAPAPNPDDTTTRRSFYGEIELSRDLQPSSDHPAFNVDYSVCMLPFVAAGFVPPNIGTGPPGPLIRQGVEVVTRLSEGVPPRAYITHPTRSAPARRPSQHSVHEMDDSVDMHAFPHLFYTLGSPSG